jgi:hypothetical protein
MPAPPFSARRRRRRLSSRLGFPCQPALSGFFLATGGPGFEERSDPGRGRIRAQKSLRAAEGLPSWVRSDSIEGSEATRGGRKNQGLFEPLVFVAAPFPAGERRLYGPPFPVSIDLPKRFFWLFIRRLGDKRTASAAGGGVAVIGVSLTSGCLARPLDGARPNRAAQRLKRRYSRPAL